MASEGEVRRFPWTRITIIVVLLAVLTWVAVRYGNGIVDYFGDPTKLRASFARLGPWGPIVSILVSAAQVLIAPIPGQMVGLANGYLYGPYIGLALSMAGLTVGGSIAMTLSRWLGRPLVEHFVDAATLDRLDRLTVHRGELFFFLVFLVPFLPDDAACFAVGLSALPIGRMLVLALLGRAPGTFVACFFGAHAVEAPPWLIALIFGIALILGVAFALYSSRLEARAFNALERAERKLEQSDDLEKTKT